MIEDRKSPDGRRRPYLAHRGPLGIFLFVVFALSVAYVAATPLRRRAAYDGVPPDATAGAVADGTGWLVMVVSGSALMIGRRLDEMGGPTGRG